MSERVARCVQKLYESACRLVDTLRETHPDAPYEELLSAVKAMETAADMSTAPQHKAVVPDAPMGKRVYRKDLVDGQKYVMNSPSSPNGWFEFDYLGETKSDNVPGLEVSSFWMRAGGKVTKWFFADAGLEPYLKSGQDPFWHESNWVTESLFDASDIDELIKESIAKLPRHPPPPSDIYS